MPSESGLWLPPIPPKERQRIDSQRKRQQRKPFAWTGFQGKTLWDYLQLLAALAIPVAVAIGTAWFSAAQSQASAIASQQQHATDIQIAQDQQQETALQNYLDHMSDLLLNDTLRKSKPGDEVRNVARTRTLTVLPQLNGIRKREVINFLYEAGLIDAQSGAVISLATADLSHANLSSADLSGADLSDANLGDADLSYASLSDADLSDASLNDANLSSVKLNDANVSGANLSDARLNDANLSFTRLSATYLVRADLSGATLSSAILSYADLSHADLSGASLNYADLSGADLSGTRMPDGSKHP